MKTEIVIALDVPESAQMDGLLDALPEAIRWGKVGLELFCAEGPASLEPLRRREWNIFLDLKLHDIPRTVAHAVTSAGRHGVQLLTIHAAGGSAMLQAAADAAGALGANRPRLLAITLLTSLGEDDLRDLGVARSAQDQVLAMAELALGHGVDGLVCSPWEAEALRQRFGPAPLLVTPGIRMAGEAVGDQKRVATPAFAAAAGASHLVIGRSITAAKDPAAAARAALRELA